MDKLKISKEWTAQERLRLIALIVDDHLNREHPMLPMQMHLVKMVATFGRPMLEANRQSFEEYLEA